MRSFFSRPMMADETKFTFRSCTEIEVRSGLVGCMQIDLSSTLSEARKVWTVVNDGLDTEAFRSEFNEVMTYIGSLFPLRESLRVFYNTHYRLAFTDNGKNSYTGLRILTQKYCYLVRIKPCGDTDNIAVYCYLYDRLKNHIQNAARGIRFVDAKDREVLTVRDGGGVRLYPGTIQAPFVCRYIDPLTCKVGKSVWNIHLLAEHLERIGKTLIPA